jgi:hypothetical protein
MPRRIVVNTKPILLRDCVAVLLCKKRAKAEGRSAAEAAAQTIIEHLKTKDNNGKRKTTEGTEDNELSVR